MSTFTGMNKLDIKINEMDKALEMANEIVYNAKIGDRKVRDIALGEILVQVIAEDLEWTLRGEHCKERRMYHLLHNLSRGHKLN